MHEPVHHTNQIYAYLPCVNGLERDDSAHEVHLLRPHIAMTLRVLAKPSALLYSCYARGAASGMCVGSMTRVSGGPECNPLVKV